jgi:hypothetical protein
VQAVSSGFALRTDMIWVAVQRNFQPEAFTRE